MLLCDSCVLHRQKRHGWRHDYIDDKGCMFITYSLIKPVKMMEEQMVKDAEAEEGRRGEGKTHRKAVLRTRLQEKSKIQRDSLHG